MKRLVLGTAVLAVASSIALMAPPAQAVPYRYRELSPYERAAIASSLAKLNALKWRARADGLVTPRERVRIRFGQARHSALVYRYRHN